MKDATQYIEQSPLNSYTEDQLILDMFRNPERWGFVDPALGGVTFDGSFYLDEEIDEMLASRNWLRAVQVREAYQIVVQKMTTAGHPVTVDSLRDFIPSFARNQEKFEQFTIGVRKVFEKRLATLVAARDVLRDNCPRY